jgi:arylformamidase
MTPAHHNRTIHLIAVIILLLGSSSCRLPQIQFASPTETVTPSPSASPSPTSSPTASPTPSPTSTPAPVMWAYQDIPYRQVDGVDPYLLSLDIYKPASLGPHPVIVMIHGGAWRGGQKDTAVVAGTKSLFFTSQSFIFVSINYRLSPEVIHPVQVEDVAAALAWIINNIPEYDGDPQWVYVMGHSSGGHLAALVATDERYLASYGLKPDIFRGVILLDAAGLDIPATMSPSSTFMYETAFGTNPKTWADASPINHVAPGKNTPPFLVCVGGQIPEWKETGQQFAIKLNEVGVLVRLVNILDKTHNAMNDDVGIPFDPLTENIMAFIQATMSLAHTSLSAWR